MNMLTSHFDFRRAKSPLKQHRRLSKPLLKPAKYLEISTQAAQMRSVPRDKCNVVVVVERRGGPTLTASVATGCPTTSSATCPG